MPEEMSPVWRFAARTPPLALQDEHAEASYDRAIEAIAAGAFADEIVPVAVPQGRKGTVEVRCV